MSQRSEILTRFVNEIACEMFTNSVISKLEKEKILRKKSKDLIYFIVMTNDKVHIYEKIEEFTNKSDICYKKEYEISTKKEIIARHIHEQHFRDKAIALTILRSLIKN
jgi:hypothetical protein